jgi:hypothetical protein
MNPAAIAAIVSLVQEAITEAPALYTEIKNLFSGDTPPTPAQWAALRAKVENESFIG